MNTITLSFREEEGYVTKTISINEIYNATKYPIRLWNKNGTFKKFCYRYKLETKQGAMYFYSIQGKDSDWNKLVEFLKESKEFNLLKDIEIEHKGYSERKAVRYFFIRRPKDNGSIEI